MNTKSVFASYLKKAGIGLAGLALGTSLFAQKAELDLKLTRQNGTPATGIVSIVGSDTTINDNTYLSPKNYILKNITAIENPVSNGKDIVVAGNPTRDGFTKLVFRNYNHLEGKIIALNIVGNTLANADISYDNEISFNTKPGMVLIQYINGTEKETFKVINNSNTFRMQFVQEQGNFAGIQNNTSSNAKLKSGKGVFSNDYSVSYTDQTLNIENYFKNFTVAPGSKYSINEILNWTLKEIKYSSHTNTNTTVKMTKVEDATILDERTAADGTFGTKSVSNRFNNETGIQVKYELTSPYTDPATFIKTQFRNQEAVMDTLRNGLYYLTIAGNGQTATIKNNGQEITTVPVGTEAFFKKQGDQVPLEVIVSKLGYVTKTTNINMNKGVLTQTITLDPAAYNHTLNISALSSIPGKTIKDNTPFYIIKDFVNTPTDTTWVNTTSGAFNYVWSDNSQTETTKVGSKNIPGHTPNSLTFTMDDSENRSITFTGLIYNLTKPVQINNQYVENIAGANITGGDTAVTTDSNGRATVAKNNLTTDVNNLPLPNYTLALTITKNNIQTSNQNVNATAGTNLESVLSVVQEYEHWLYGNSTTPAGTLVKGWKGGTAVHTATVSGTNYETNHIKRTTKTFTLDSLTFSATQYVSQKILNQVLTEGGNKVEATLAPVVINYSHSLNISALSSISGKTIKDNTRIYVLKDFVNTPTDTTWINTTNGAAALTWSDNNQTEQTKIGSKQVPGHTPNSLAFTMDDSENRNITFTGLIYNLTKPVQINNQYVENVAGASIAGGDAAVTTDSNGRATVAKNNLVTDVNNLPLLNYTLALTITKSNIQTSNQNVNATAGVNSESLLNVVQEYEHWLYGTSTSPDGALAQIWKNGTPVQSGTVSGSAYQTNHIKRTTKTFVADSITITKNNYTRFSEANTTFVDGGNKKEATLTQLPTAVHDFYVIVKDINGVRIPDFTQTFKLENGTDKQYTTDANGVMHFLESEYGTPSTKLKVTNTSTKYNDAQIYRRTNQSLADTNYCQTQKFNGLPQFAELKLANIPDTLIEYKVMQKVKTPTTLVPTYGDSINIDHSTIRDMMGGRFGGTTTKFISRPGAENIFVFQMTFNETTGLPVDQTNLDRAKAELDKVLAIYTLNDGTKLLNYEFYKINSYTDPKWLESKARDNHDNMAYTTFDNSSPLNGGSLTLTYSTNGKARIKNADSYYNTGSTQGQICSEIYESINHNKDPPENTAPWVYTTTQISDAGKTIARLIYFFNQGTPTQ